MTKLKILVTGASGLLGRSVVKEFQSDAERFDVVGTAFSRANSNYYKVDLTDENQIKQMVQTTKPDVCIHCAAEKRPDVVAQNKEQAFNLNTQIPGTLAKEIREIGSTLIYISTDYVFDGATPPYKTTDPVRPLNDYGMSKLKGEESVLENDPTALILRVPVLFGTTEKTNESAVNILIDTVKNSSKEVVVDDYHIRYPTCVDDVARVLKQMVATKLFQGKPLRGIYHFSSEEKRTKYEMCIVIGAALGLETKHIIPDKCAPKDPIASRPKDAHLSVDRLLDEGISCSCISLRDWMKKNI